MGWLGRTSGSSAYTNSHTMPPSLLRYLASDISPGPYFPRFYEAISMILPTPPNTCTVCMYRVKDD